MSSSQSYSSGFGTGSVSNNFGTISNNNNAGFTPSMSTGLGGQAFATSSGWNAFSTAPSIPTPQQQQQQQHKPDLSAFDSLLPMSKPKQSLSTLQSSQQPQIQVPNYFQSGPLAATSSNNGGMLFPKPATNVKTLSPSDINDLLS
jgi:hypothetical protein